MALKGSRPNNRKRMRQKRIRGLSRRLRSSPYRWVLIGISSLLLFLGLGQPSLSQHQPLSNQPSPAALKAGPSTVQRNSSVIRLRRGPYFPGWETIAPPFPNPVWPEIIEPMRLVIRLGDRRVYVYQGDEISTSFPIAVGKPGWETPVGEYAVTNMLENPDWRNPFTGEVIPTGSNNPLGDRWIGFWTDGNNVIGFHGTPNEGSVGRAASHGCVRMFNHDIRQLYAIAEVGMPVIVEP